MRGTFKSYSAMKSDGLFAKITAEAVVIKFKGTVLKQRTTVAATQVWFWRKELQTGNPLKISYDLKSRR